MKTFDELKVKETVQKGIQELGFNVPFPIQAQAIPILLEGYDVIGQAHTGTGKTAAFALPLLQWLEKNKEVVGPKGVRTLILAPTRE